MCLKPCNTCGSCAPCTCEQNEGCLDIYNSSCIKYDGIPLVCTDTDSGVSLNELVVDLHQAVCDLKDDSGLVKADASDQYPNTLIDKLQAGANIVISGTGIGPNKKVKIDAVLGGQILDEKVRVSATDSSTGYLEDKLIGGECVSLLKINPGINEKIKVVIDWNCVLTKLMAQAGWCTSIQTCIGDVQLAACASISLNSPILSGSDVTLSWASSGTQFNVYIDGVLEPGMPTSMTSYTKSGLNDGTHFAQVSAVCNTGTPISSTTSFTINTTCPSASALSVTLTGGVANLGWTPGSGINIFDQIVQSKLRSSATWTTASTVSAIASNASIGGLITNKIYDFSILTDCVTGGPTLSPVTSQVELVCPALTLTPSNTAIQYQFQSAGYGDVEQYIVELLDATATTVLQTKTETIPFASTVTNSFIGLVSATSYQIRVKVKAQEFLKSCTPVATSTSAPPSCPPPSGMSASLT